MGVKQQLKHSSIIFFFLTYWQFQKSETGLQSDIMFFYLQFDIGQSKSWYVINPLPLTIGSSHADLSMCERLSPPC